MNGLHRLKTLKKNPLTKEQMMALQRVPIPSPNYSSRDGSGVRLIVLHTAEGALTYQALGNYFKNPASQVSSHTGIDDTPGVIGEYVQRPGKAWTSANANPVAVQTELCAFASWDSAEWSRHPQMLKNCAAWIAEEAAYFGLPIVKLTPTQAQTNGRGVCQHSDLGAWGGSHWDCGPNFPIDQVIAMATGVAPTPQEPETVMWLLQDDTSGGYWQLADDGGVYAYDGAPYLGGPNLYNPSGFKPAGLATFRDKSGSGYCATLDFGPSSGGDRFRRYRFPRDGSAAKG